MNKKNLLDVIATTTQSLNQLIESACEEHEILIFLDCDFDHCQIKGKGVRYQHFFVVVDGKRIELPGETED